MAKLTLRLFGAPERVETFDTDANPDDADKAAETMMTALEDPAVWGAVMVNEEGGETAHLFRRVQPHTGD